MIKEPTRIFRFKAVGLSYVNWSKYDFHITPVLTYTYAESDNHNNGKCLALEWGHWAVYIGYFKLE
jgi:hypothetical protein